MSDDDPLDADQLPNVPAPVSSARLLTQEGFTLAEIAAQRGCTEAEVAAELAADGGGSMVSAAHVMRIESAMVQRAMGGSITEEKLDRAGMPVAVTRQLEPDPVAGKLLLQAHAPMRYGAEASVAVVSVNEAERLAHLGQRLVELMRSGRAGQTIEAEPVGEQKAIGSEGA